MCGHCLKTCFSLLPKTMRSGGKSTEAQNLAFGQLFSSSSFYLLPGCVLLTSVNPISLISETGMWNSYLRDCLEV